MDENDKATRDNTGTNAYPEIFSYL